MRILPFLLVCGALLLPCALANAGAPPALYLQQDGKLVLTPQGKKGTITALEAAEVKKSALRWVKFEEDSMKTYGVEPGIAFFDKAGKQVAMLPMSPDEDYMSSGVDDVELSPSGGVVGLEFMNGSMYVTYPDMKPLGFSGIASFWNGNKGILYLDSPTDENIMRPCKYDFCGPCSVMYYNFADQKSTVVKAGTPECDYRVQAFAPETGTVTLEEICLPTMESWIDQPSTTPTKILTVQLKQ